MVTQLVPAVEIAQITRMSEPETRTIMATAEVEANFERGVAALKREDYTDAVEAFQHVIQDKQDVSAAWFNKAWALFRLANFPGALEAFDALVEIQGDIPKAWYNRGVVLERLGRYDEAVESFVWATQLEKFYADAWFNKGIILERQSKYREAQRAYEGAISLKPDFADDALYRKGIVLYRLGKYQQAIEAFEEALTLQPHRSQACYNKGAYLFTLKKFEEAAESFDRALQLRPEYSRANLAKAISHWHLDVMGEARSEFQKAFDNRLGLEDAVGDLYSTWSRFTAARGMTALLDKNIPEFEAAGMKFIDIMEKAEADGLRDIVDEARVEFKQRLKKKREIKAFEEFELFVDLMKIKDPFEGCHALGKAISERWPKGVSAVQAVREMRR